MKQDRVVVGKLRGRRFQVDNYFCIHDVRRDMVCERCRLDKLDEYRAFVGVVAAKLRCDNDFAAILKHLGNLATAIDRDRKEGKILIVPKDVYARARDAAEAAAAAFREFDGPDGFWRP